MASRTEPRRGTPPRHLSLRALIGSGDRIMLFTAPFAVVGVVLNIVYPGPFEVGGPPPALRSIAIVALIIGVAVWAWSIALILTRMPRGELITTGPYALVKHPIYTSVALLVLPSIGIVLNSWLGAAIGVVMYVASRRFAPAEEEELSRTFGDAWTEYADGVRLPRL